MLIELSIPNKPVKAFWENVNKQLPVYSISDVEIKKARVQQSIGIIEPRVHVSKLRMKLGDKGIIVRSLIVGNKNMRLYKDEEGFYLKEIDW